MIGWLQYPYSLYKYLSLSGIGVFCHLDLDQQGRQPNEIARVPTTKTWSHNSGVEKYSSFNHLISY